MDYTSNFPSLVFFPFFLRTTCTVTVKFFIYIFSLCTSLLFLLVLITIMYFVFFCSLFICTSNWILNYVSGGPYLSFYRFIYVKLSYSVDVIYVISFDDFIIIKGLLFVNTFFLFFYYFFILSFHTSFYLFSRFLFS